MREKKEERERAHETGNDNSFFKSDSQISELFYLLTFSLHHKYKKCTIKYGTTTETNKTAYKRN